MTGETQQNFALIGEAVVFLFSLPGRRCPPPLKQLAGSYHGLHLQ